MPHVSTMADAPYFGADLRTQRRVSRQARTAIWNGALRMLSTLAARYQSRRNTRRAIAELGALSDRMLSDIGIHRHDIPRIAHDSRDWSDGRK
jgi:uncharacterized protein YjiS (DUF1127 family)